MAQELAARNWVPDLVLSSDSMRTRETWSRMAEALDTEVEVEFTPDLYHGGTREVLHRCADLANVETVMVLGHNPGWEDVVEYLTGDYHRMTTANCALLVADGSWSDLMTEGCWELSALLRPKEL